MAENSLTIVILAEYRNTRDHSKVTLIKINIFTGNPPAYFAYPGVDINRIHFAPDSFLLICINECTIETWHMYSRLGACVHACNNK